MFKPECEDCGKGLTVNDLKGIKICECGMPISAPNLAGLKKMAGLADADVPQAVDVNPAPATYDVVPECNHCAYEFYGDSVKQYESGTCPNCRKDPRAEDRPTGPSYESQPASQVPTPPPAIHQVDTPPDSGAPQEVYIEQPVSQSNLGPLTTFTFCHGPLVGQTIELPYGIPIGRSQFKEQVGKDFPGYDRISGNHFEMLMFTGPRSGVRDLTSTNGTFVNGQRVLSTVDWCPESILEIAGKGGIAMIETDVGKIVEKTTGVCVPVGVESCIGRDPDGSQEMHPILRFLRTHNMVTGQTEEDAEKLIATVSRKHASVKLSGTNVIITNHSGLGTKVTSGGVTHELTGSDSVEVPAAGCELCLGKLTFVISGVQETTGIEGVKTQ